jgi:alpha-D-ribose 1-methylphosphonate 5-triphosphate synthase subunit PhnI
VAVHHHILPLTLQETQKSTETQEERSLRRQKRLRVRKFFPREEMKRRQLTIDDLHRQPINLIHIETPKTQQLMQADPNMIIIE